MDSSAGNDLEALDAAMTELHQVMSRWGFWEEITRKSGVTLDRTSAKILRLAASESSEERHPSHLAARLGVEAPSITRKVQKLEEDGLVERVADKYDRRACTVKITSSGRRALKSLHKAKLANLASALENWPRQDRRKLADLCQRLAKDMQERS